MWSLFLIPFRGIACKLDEIMQLPPGLTRLTVNSVYLGAGVGKGWFWQKAVMETQRKACFEDIMK